jgi:hypothetical protein
MEGMKKFNIGGATEELVQQEKAHSKHDSITVVKKAILEAQEKLAGMTERGKDLLLDDLESIEFNILTLQKQEKISSPELNKILTPYNKIMHHYEQMYGPYTAQLSSEADIHGYIQKLEKRNEARGFGVVKKEEPQEESLAA